MPFFGEFSRSSQDSCELQSDSHKSRDDQANLPKSGMLNFLDSFGREYSEKFAPKGARRKLCAESSTPKAERRKHRAERLTPKG